METRALAPLYNPTTSTTAGSLQSSLTVSASTTAAGGQLPGLTNQNDVDQIQIANEAAAWAYVNVGVQGNVTAVTAATGYPVAPGSVVVISVHPEVSGVSVILASGTGNVIFTRGEGL